MHVYVCLCVCVRVHIPELTCVSLHCHVGWGGRVAISVADITSLEICSIFRGLLIKLSSCMQTIHAHVHNIYM